MVFSSFTHNASVQLQWFNAFNWNQKHMSCMFSALILPSRNVPMFGTFNLQTVQITHQNHCNPLQNTWAREQQHKKCVNWLDKYVVCEWVRAWALRLMLLVLFEIRFFLFECDCDCDCVSLNYSQTLKHCSQNDRFFSHTKTHTKLMQHHVQ